MSRVGPFELSRRDALLALLVGVSAAACKRSPDAAGPEVLGPIGEFALEDQHGRPFTHETVKGEAWVGSFFFTRCPTVCPRLMTAVGAVQAQAKARSVRLRFVSITVDPEHDTGPVLARYAADRKLDLSNWSLVRGSLHAIKKTSVEGFKMALEGRADAAAADLGILHGSHLVLVDGRGRIRGYYRALDADVAPGLLADAERLASE